MRNPVRKTASDDDNETGLPEVPKTPAVASDTSSPADVGSSFPETATEAIAALLHLIKLMGGELVLNVAGGETERFERAVRAKIEQYTSPTANPAARKLGLAFATHLVEQVLTQLRAQAEVKRSLGKGQNARRQEAREDNSSATSVSSKFLN